MEKQFSASLHLKESMRDEDDVDVWIDEDISKGIYLDLANDIVNLTPAEARHVAIMLLQAAEVADGG